MGYPNKLMLVLILLLLSAVTACKKEKNFDVGIRLEISGTVSQDAMITYRDAGSELQTDSLALYNWQNKSFSVNEGYNVYVSVSGSSLNGSIDLLVSATSDGDDAFEAHYALTSNGMGFSYTAEKVLE